MITGLAVEGRVAGLDGHYFRSTAVKPNGTVDLGYTGVGFPGNPAFQFDEERQFWHATVSAEECERIVEIGRSATYRGAECTVTFVLDTDVVLVFSGGDAQATDLGFGQIERGVYGKTVPFAELDNCFEEHRDLYFPYWQQQTFGYQLGAWNWAEHKEPDPQAPEVGYPRFRMGRYAVLDGQEYGVAGTDLTGPVTLTSKASTQPHPDAQRDERTGQWRLTVPIDALTTLVEVSVRAWHRVDSYSVTAMWPGGLATLRAEGNLERAARSGFAEVAPGQLEKQAPVSLLYGYREIHRNLLFDRWLGQQVDARQP